MIASRPWGAIPSFRLLDLRDPLDPGEPLPFIVRRASTGAVSATLSKKPGQAVPEAVKRETGQPPFASLSALADTTPFPRVLLEGVYGLLNT